MFVLVQMLMIPILVLLPLATVYLPTTLVSEITTGSDIVKAMLTIGGIIIFILVLKLLQNYFTVITNKHNERLTYQYLLELDNKTLTMDFEHLSNLENNAKYRKVFTAIFENKYTATLLSTFAGLVSALLGISVYTGILSKVNLWILIIIILCLLINYLFGLHINHWDFKNREKWLTLDNKMSYLTYMAGDFASSKDVRLYHMQDWIAKRFRIDMKERIYWTGFMQANYYVASVINNAMILLRDGAAYLYLIGMTLAGNINAAEFVLYFGLITGFTTWCESIIEHFKKLHEINLNLADKETYMSLQDKTNREDGIALPTKNEIPFEIRFEHVSYRYAGAESDTLQDISLTIKPGEKIALVGVNGAGKTTFVKLPCGLYDPTQGTIYVNGKDRALYNRQAYFSLFSSVFQEEFFLPISIEDNIICGGDRNEALVTECLKKAGMEQKVQNLSLGQKTLLVKEMNESAVSLSGGEEQKLMLARALYKNAPVLVLDEPTAALDPIAESEIYEKYNEITKNKSSVFVSHRLASTRFCDRILLIENGQIVEEGSHEELLKAGGRYAEMFEVQSKYYSTKEDHTNEEE